MGSHVLKAFFYIDAVKADKIRRKSYEKTIVIGNIVIVFVADNGADRGVCGGKSSRCIRHIGRRRIVCCRAGSA